MTIKNTPTTSLILTTYNWPEALELVLLSIVKQSVLPDEIIIGDDGSGPETKAVITKYQNNYSVPIIHVWHEDDGFRKTEILNKVIARATSEYIIKIDGDIILHRHFVKNHLQMCEKGVYTCGSRVSLSDEASKKAQETKNISYRFFSKGNNNRLNALYNPFLMKLFSYYNDNLMKIRGCNTGMWRDLIEITGYNEDMIGWGREDSEISARLTHAKKRKKNNKFGALNNHQHQSFSSRSELNENHEIFS
ncbi:MAG: glycosyltransferase family 2 protein [Gelidibacter sp.]|uniref:glycosyltransferase family 2 protein n=1 Tax=Gelidibacter sp. TaxID=2018083 RepID=UPI00326630B2